MPTAVTPGTLRWLLRGPPRFDTMTRNISELKTQPTHRVLIDNILELMESRYVIFDVSPPFSHGGEGSEEELETAQRI